MNLNTLDILLEKADTPESRSQKEHDSEAGRGRGRPIGTGGVAERLPDEVLNELQEMGTFEGEVKPLFGTQNFRGASYAPKKESYVHRQIAFIKSAQPGLSNRELGLLVGRHEVTVAYILRQSYMQDAILREMKNTYDPAMQLLQNEAFDAATRLVEIAKGAENDETRRKANNDILDRKYGKPNQPMSVQKKSANDMSDAELAEIIQGVEAKTN